MDRDDRWPGQVPEYQDYLARTLAAIKYTTGTAPAQAHGHCPLCGHGPITVYPNALKGAGINFANMDREGAFPGLDSSRAWQGYALCLDCADLLYVFKFHVMEQFQGRIAGRKALVLPALLGNPSGRHRFMKDWHDYIQGLTGAKVEDIEADLMEFFAGRDDAHLVLHILWADFGQVIDNCRGLVTDILPSRLQQLDRCNHAANAWRHPLAPKVRIDEAEFDLGMNFLFPLFKRPGGKPAKAANASPRLFAIKRHLTEHLYQGSPLPDPGPLQEVLLDTARWYLGQAADDGKPWGLIGEGLGKKGIPYWTLAGWVRHLARLYHYLDITGVLPMSPEPGVFQPRMEALKPYFTPGSGIDRPEKAFAFLLGALYGKLLQVQGARGVNVSANALTWLRRLNLSGRDLPELYVKVREKLLSYGTESSHAVRELLHELGRLGTELGDRIDLDNTATCYFLLLGQSITSDLLPSRSDSNGD
ncbi:MAG: TM1802 family CRISPR-associated protein [Pseudomonadota bacterium]|nr:TM1802 family CRISPR-associated protein [Pseudomonadota bacterium]